MLDSEGPPTLMKRILIGLRCACPRCGKGKVFDGFLALKPSCSHCGLSYDFADSGDGPAVFVILVVGFVVIALVLWSEVTYAPPLWLHALLWIPTTLVLSLAALRGFKGVMIALQYHHGAAEGAVDRDSDVS